MKRLSGLRVFAVCISLSMGLIAATGLPAVALAQSAGGESFLSNIMNNGPHTTHMITILTEFGYEATRISENGNPPVLSAQKDGLSFTVNFEDCVKNDCSRAHFIKKFTGDFSPTKISEWNRLYGSAAIAVSDGSGSGSLGFDVDMSGPFLSGSTIRTQFDKWIGIFPIVTSHFGGQAKAQPQPQPATDATVAKTQTASVPVCGNAAACNTLGGKYLMGNGVKLNFATAVMLYKKACDGGNADGCGNLGEAYFYGWGVTKDKAIAAPLYKKACDGGNLNGCITLGQMNMMGDSIARNVATARLLFNKACDGGNMRGCVNLGNSYSHGEVSAQDLKTAARLYTKACNGGDAIGCYNLGSMYGDGFGVPKNMKTAILYYKKALAIDPKYSDAQFRLDEAQEN
jgi:TPR repeat protein